MVYEVQLKSLTRRLALARPEIRDPRSEPRPCTEQHVGLTPPRVDFQETPSGDQEGLSLVSARPFRPLSLKLLGNTSYPLPAPYLAAPIGYFDVCVAEHDEECDIHHTQYHDVQETPYM